MSDVQDHSARIERVESEVSTIRSEIGGIKTEMSGLKSDVRGLSGILQRIEAGVAQAHQRFDEDKQAARLNPVAVATVLLSIITVLIGGAWLVGGELARHDERSIFLQKAVDRNEQRLWASRGGRDVVPAPAR